MLQSWSKQRKILLSALAAVALSGLLFLVGFAAIRALPASAAADSTGRDDAQAQVQNWTLSADYEPTTMAPAPILTFRADPDHPIPEDGYVHPLGEPFALLGTVYSNRSLASVTVSISCAHNSQKPYPYKQRVRLSDGSAVYDFQTVVGEDGKALSELVDFSQLLVGVHTLKISAACEGSREIELFRWKFLVAGPDWEESSTELLFPEDVPAATTFFGSEERFLYPYQIVNGRYILADPAWEAAYITTITGYPNEDPWLVHVDAVPYFEKAFEYLETSYVRVHGTNGDTGVLPARNLITEYNGCYVSRFTSANRVTLSHHSFGTAVDVNASMACNKNTADNKKIIDDEVKDHLFYNGILQESGVVYYDFTYDGEAATDANGVPQTCVNYLLYELSFFRAGFDWAHYYKSSSDGMHFCLSEHVTYTHDGEMGLRKITTYAAPVRLDAQLRTPIPVAATTAPTADPSGAAPSASAQPTATEKPVAP